MDTIQLNERDYKRLLDGRNAFAKALRQFVSVANTNPVNNADLAQAVKDADALLSYYGEHQAFVIL